MKQPRQKGYKKYHISPKKINTKEIQHRRSNNYCSSNKHKKSNLTFININCILDTTTDQVNSTFLEAFIKGILGIPISSNKCESTFLFKPVES